MVDRSLVPVMVAVFLSGTIASRDIEKCRDGESRRGSLNLSIQSQRNKSGEWLTTFITTRDSEDSTNIIKLDLNHTVVECGGKKLVQVHGILRDTPVFADFKSCQDKLMFNSAHAKNIELTNFGRTAYRKSYGSNCCFGTALTNRALNREELFEVQIFVNNTGWTDQMAIGVTPLYPPSIVFSSLMTEQKKDTWMMFDSDIYHNSSKVKTSYGTNLATLKSGDRIGVKVKNDNTLHFFVNGEDQGIAAENIPSHVYGFVEVLRNVVSVTITDNC